MGRCPSLDARRRHGPAASAGRRVGSAADDTQGVTQSVAQSAAQGVDLQARLLLLLILAARWQQRQRRSWLCELLRQAVLVRHQQRRAGRVGRWASQTLAGRRSFSYLAKIAHQNIVSIVIKIKLSFKAQLKYHYNSNLNHH